MPAKGTFTHITNLSIMRTTADLDLIFTAYNLPRIMNLIGIEALKSRLLT
jgi:hypothetical protein